MNLKYLLLAPLLVLPSLPSCGCGGDSGNISGCPPPPFVQSVDPLNGAIDVALASEICVTFSTPMLESTVNGQTFLVVERGGPIVVGTIIFTQPNLTACFIPMPNLLPCTIYDIAVSGGATEDICGQPLAAFTSSFTTTGVNCVPPGPPGPCVPQINFGTAVSYAVLAGTTVTNTGPTTLNGDLGLHPGSSVTGAPVVTGVTNVANAPALAAKNDLIIAYNDAVAAPSTATRIGDIGGEILTAGVYTSTSDLSVLSADLILIGGQDDVFIFQMVSTLTVATGRKVLLQGVRPCNVIWQVGSSATLNGGAEFVGTILALTDINLVTGATVAGRLLARNGQVVLQSNIVTVP